MRQAYHLIHNGLMKVKDFQNREYNWPPADRVANFDDTSNKSELHLKCRQLLRELYPTRPPLEEVPIPGTQLRFDFVLPQRRICIEVQGEQHSQDNRFFFNDRLSFGKAQQNDKKKKEWCSLNNLLLIELLFDEDIDDWKDKILLAKH